MSDTRHEAEAGSDYARLADDCDRWGLVEEAADLRARYRETVIRQLREGAQVPRNTSRFRFPRRVA